MDWDCRHAPFILSLQRLRDVWGSVESLWTSPPFATGSQVAERWMWEQPYFSRLYPHPPAEVHSYSEGSIGVGTLRPCSVDLLAKDRITLHLVFDLSDGVNYRRVIAPSEELPDPHE